MAIVVPLVILQRLEMGPSMPDFGAPGHWVGSFRTKTDTGVGPSNSVFFFVEFGSFKNNSQNSRIFF